MKKKLKKFAIISGILFLAALTLFVLWATWENWSGAREWGKTRAMLIANDVVLDLAEILPPTPADEDNFCTTPLIASLFDFDATVNNSIAAVEADDTSPVYQQPEIRQRLLAMTIAELSQKDFAPDWNTSRHAKLSGIHEKLASADEDTLSIPDWLMQFNSEIQELDDAANRPEAHIPSEVSDDFIANLSMPLPYFQDLQKLVDFQLIRACNALEVGDTAEALLALETLFKVDQACLSHQTLIGLLVGMASLDDGLSIAWQGMANQQWSADQLRAIQTLLSNVDLLGPLERSLNVEMVAMQIDGAEYLKTISLSDSLELAHVIASLDSGRTAEPSPLGLVSLVVPSGIWDHNKSFGCRVLYEQGILPVRERRFPDAGAFTELMKNRSHRTFLASITIPAISTVINRAYHGAVAVDLATVACALELYHLEIGDYPSSLDRLIPKYLTKIPTDLAQPGSPLRYGKGLQGDRYRIYSLGENLTDEGGKVTFRKRSSGSPRRDLSQGDWAWGYTFEKPSLEAE